MLRLGQFLLNLDEQFRKDIINRYKPDVFINNAGIISDDISEILEVNTTAAIHLLDGFYHKMDSGYIINIGSFGQRVYYICNQLS